MAPQRKKPKPSAADPNSLAGKLIYLSGLQHDETWREMDETLILISEDQHDHNQDNSSYVFGYIIDGTRIRSLRDDFLKAGRIPHHSLQKVQYVETPEGFTTLDVELRDNYTALKEITFITGRSPDRYPHKKNFAGFSAYPIDNNLDLVEQMAKQLKDRERKFIIAYGEIILDREVLVEMERMGYVHVRNSNVNIVLDDSVVRRTTRAFPDLFDFKF